MSSEAGAGGGVAWHAWQGEALAGDGKGLMCMRGLLWHFLILKAEDIRCHHLCWLVLLVLVLVKGKIRAP